MMSEYNRYILAKYMRNIPYWLNIGSILYQYGCATRDVCFLKLFASVLYSKMVTYCGEMTAKSPASLTYSETTVTTDGQSLRRSDDCRTTRSITTNNVVSVASVRTGRSGRLKIRTYRSQSDVGGLRRLRSADTQRWAATEC